MGLTCARGPSDIVRFIALLSLALASSHRRFFAELAGFGLSDIPNMSVSCCFIYALTPLCQFMKSSAPLTVGNFQTLFSLDYSPIIMNNCYFD